ncbi:hypothetical protein GAO09_24860 [Rhizobiales bacterium RZME27]|uniref:LysM domain-containing protein n=1 Tax=Endobacterium cereale TaxID=2663029 RepID=A0A6A8ADR8_9HYPH|nr:LysM peptidoglycan-binding domain-containing protein [Endobacterium cereale]MEB2847422.1 LysM peptidoglycan-binding domain-containing protein [Endobacterium cereale]MQY49272.1 hypothetical protein [Endobacterium cereale]
MAYRIDVNARNRFNETGEASSPIPDAQGEAFRRDIALVTREREGRERDGGKDQAEIGDRIFVVETGDTLENIARENHADPADAMEINADPENHNGDLLHPGDIIILPAPEPEIVAETALDADGKPVGEDDLISSLHERGNRVEYADPVEGIDTATEIDAMKQDVADYLAALPPETRQDAALRLSQTDWVDAGPAGIAVEKAVTESGLETGPVEAFASELRDRGNALEYADPSVSIDQSREITTLAGDIGTFLETLPEKDRTDALQNLFDRDWRDAGPAQVAIEQAASASGITLKSSGHNGPELEGQVRSAVDRAKATSEDGELQFRAFAETYANADPELKQALLGAGYGGDFIRSMADYATQPLGDYDPAVHMQSKPYETFLRLDAMTGDLPTGEADKTEAMPPELAAALVSAAMPELERANALHMESTGSPMLGYGGVGSLLKVADRIEGTPVGDAAIDRFADMGFYAPNELTRSIGEGGSLQYPLELSERNGTDTTLLERDILPGVRQTQAETNSAVSTYAAHMEELRWMTQNFGETMTPEEMQAAIADYKAQKNIEDPTWIDNEKKYEADVTAHGNTLLDQISQLNEVPDQPAEQRAVVDKEIEAILNDDRSYLAIQAAIRNDPSVIDKPGVLDFASQQARLTDRGRKLVDEITTQVVQRDVLPKLANFKPGDEASLKEVQAGLATFRDGKIAKLLGVTEKDMNKAIDAIERSLPSATDGEAEIKTKMEKLDKDLQGLAGHKKDGIRAFSNKTIPGQLLRTIGATAAATGLFNSVQTAGTQPNVENILKATFDSVGMWQRSVEIRSGLGMMDPDSFVVKNFDSSVKLGTKAIGVVGAVFDGVNSVQAFMDDNPWMGAAHAVTAVGGATAAIGAGSMFGVVGVGVTILGVGATMVIADVQDKSKYETEASKRFLNHSALDEEASAILIDQSGGGHSPVPLLLEYAEKKGFDLDNDDHRNAFAEWVNAMSADQLTTLRDNLHHTIDDFGGNEAQLAITAPDDYEYTSSTFYDREVVTPYKTFLGERFYVEGGDASPSSVTQIEVALGTLGIPQLAVPTS